MAPGMLQTFLQASHHAVRQTTPRHSLTAPHPPAAVPILSGVDEWAKPPGQNGDRRGLPSRGRGSPPPTLPSPTRVEGSIGLPLYQIWTTCSPTPRRRGDCETSSNGLPPPHPPPPYGEVFPVEQQPGSAWVAATPCRATGVQLACRNQRWEHGRDGDVGQKPHDPAMHDHPAQRTALSPGNVGTCERAAVFRGQTSREPGKTMRKIVFNLQQHRSHLGDEP